MNKKKFTFIKIIICLLCYVSALNTVEGEQLNSEYKTSVVRALYMVPKDREVRSAYKKAVEHALFDLQKWYAYHTGGYTFRLAKPPLRIVKTTHPAEWYGTNKKGEGEKLRTFNNALLDAREITGVEVGNDGDIWVIYVDARGWSGLGRHGLAILPEHDCKGLVGEDPKIKYTPRWIGGFGHEIGHAFSLPHPGKDHPESIMQFGYKKYPNCNLTRQEAAVLRHSPHFNRLVADKKITYEPYGQKSYLYHDGFFIKTGEKQWEERKYRSGKTLQFKEINKQDDFILLKKEGYRDFFLRLPLKGDLSYFSYGGKVWKELYKVKQGYTSNKVPSTGNSLVQEKYLYNGGCFINTGDKKWIEMKDKGKVLYFNCIRKDKVGYVLFDVSRDIYVQLPLNGGWAKFSYHNDKSWKSIYRVKKVK